MGGRYAFLRSTKGAAALEYALVLPFILYFFFGAVEISLIVLAQNALDTGVVQATRFGRTGDVVTGSTRETTIVQIVRSYTFGLLDPTKITVTLKSYDSIVTIGPGLGVASGGTGKQYVVYTAQYPWQILTPFLATVLGDSGTTNGVRTLSSTVIVQNEPF